MKKRALLPWAVAASVVLAPVAAMAQSAPVLPGGGMEAYGSTGRQVAILQADLSALKDWPGPLDGIFGPKTLGAVRAFQRQAGIAVDGIAGPITWRAIHQRVSDSFHLTTGTLAATGADYGDVGTPVLQLQQDLASKGFNPGPENGVFLKDTAHAVQAFERAHGIALNDAIGGATLTALQGGAVDSGTTQNSSGTSQSSSGTTQSSSGTSSPSTGAGAGAGTRTGSSSAASPSTQTIDGHAVVREINLTATAYSPSLKDNYPYGPVDYYGRPLVAGDVAVDPTVIPLGTLMWVTGYSSPFLPAGGFLAHAVDTGGAIKGDRLDIFINSSESNVSNFGIQPVKAYILGN
ncbi:MAG: peptidoglycan-binding protein [Thermaerobacter sp.]|nr:peptidoglycan-binding protein [Thermaerobacter sp.]